MSTDPITLAREVLGGDDASDDRFLDFFEARAIAQALARAVVRVADALDSLERDTTAWETATRNFNRGSLGSDESAILVARETENRIRAALNGDNA